MSAEPIAKTLSSPLRADLAAALADAKAGAKTNPFTNPYLFFALQLTRRLDREEKTLDGIEDLIGELTWEAFVARSARLNAYLGAPDPAKDEAAIRKIFEHKAKNGDFTGFNAFVSAVSFGVVFTAHPTFSLNIELTRALIDLATGFDAAGKPLTEAGRTERLALANRLEHKPPPSLTLDVEHAWSMEALTAANDALARVHRAAFAVARKAWPERWTELSPRLISLASWVGYDQDGRTDITWNVMLEKRLAVKAASIKRHMAAVAAWRADYPEAALSPLADMLAASLAAVEKQMTLLAAATRDPAATDVFARAMVGLRETALADLKPLFAELDRAIKDAPHEDLRESLLVMRSALRTQGLSLAHTHVRLNASQLHNAIRRQIGLTTPPEDPANRRTYFGLINELLSRARTVQINFANLLTERASAKRLMMTIAQMMKFVDGSSPVRFLIAETETGFTLLTALYYARIFGVEDHVEISPLFETEEAFDRGEKVIEEALKSPIYVEHIKRQGRIAVQFGFSDSGRFIGQMAATFRIERLRLRLAQLLASQGLQDIEIVLFNTHGESIGRGGHPATLADRLRYVAPPVNRAEFAKRGIRVREEVSFQGGDGFLHFFTPTAALASLKGILEFVGFSDWEAEDDPVYSESDYAVEFFAGVQQEFTSLVDDPDYAALLGLFGPQLIYQTGSRPVLRQRDDWAAPPTLAHVSQLRAIPNNAILQQMAYMANTLFGVGRSAAKNPEMFQSLLTRSPRFKRALAMVKDAMEFSDLGATRAYIDTVNPAMWLVRASVAPGRSRAVALGELRALTEHAGLHDRLARVLRRLQAEQLLLMESIPAPETERRDRMMLLHALRITLIQRICLLATRVPDFSPQHGVTPLQIRERIMRLEIPKAVALLREIFPKEEAGQPRGDFGEPSTYKSEAAYSYAVEHEVLFQPLLRLYDLVLKITSAITHDIGACG